MIDFILAQKEMIHGFRSNRQSLRTNVTLLALVLFLIALFFPSVNYQIFDGLPLSHPLEFLAFVLLVPFFASRGIRRLYQRVLHQNRVRFDYLLVCSSVLVLGTKLILFWSGTLEGFLACYGSPAAAPVASPCEKSFENPLYRFGATRLDPTIDFDESNWNLSFINSNRFNFYWWVNGNIWRDRLPLTATWRGTLDTTEEKWLKVTSVGGAQVTLGDETVQIEPQYDELARTVLYVPPGKTDLVVDYVFDDGYRIGGEGRFRPYATFKLQYVSGPDGDWETGAVSASKPPGIMQVLGGLADALMLCVVFSLLIVYLIVSRRHWKIILFILLAGAGVTILPDSKPFNTLLVCFLLGYLVARNKHRHLLLIYSLLLYLSFLRMSNYYPNFNTVFYRSVSDDWLTYESFARDILDRSSLEGGEPIFVYQPLFRYIKFTEHLLFGDGDWLIATFALSLMNFSVFQLFARLYRKRESFYHITPAVVGGLLLLLLLNSELGIWGIRASLSEYPTWIFLLWCFPMLFVSDSPMTWILGTILLGSAVVTRFNQAPALLFMFFVFLLTRFRSKPMVIALATIVLGLVVLSPLAHNYYYGHQLILLPTEREHPTAEPLSPLTLIQAWSDPEVQAVLINQLTLLFPMREFLATNDLAWKSFLLVLLGLAFFWICSLVLTRLSKRPVHWVALILTLTPLMYLGVHVFYNVSTYYPRHIIVGYLAFGVTAIYLLSPKAQRELQPQQITADAEQ